MTASSCVIHTKDGREITLALTPQTKYVKGDASIEANKIAPRTTVHVDASEDGESNLTAVKIELLKDAPTREAEGTPSIRERDGAGSAKPKRSAPMQTTKRFPIRRRWAKRRMIPTGLCCAAENRKRAGTAGAARIPTTSQ